MKRAESEESSMDLEKTFHHEMILVGEFALSHGFGTRFMNMVNRYGGVDAAKRLLAKQEIQSGLMELYYLGELGKSMEALVILDRFRELFEEEEIAEARRRLEELKYFD